jgi:formylglycine-generating enzyme required for sulfatase activity
MKKIYLILQSVFFVAALCVGFTSCNSEDDGMASPTENDSPNGDKIFTVGGVSFTMKEVAGGTFTMGATSEQGSDAGNNEKPAHQVTLSNYYIGETEVTQALWHAVMGSNPSFRKGVNLPVEQVSWDDCQEFIKELNRITGKKFRLPTEAEWEYAARGGNKSKGYKYSGSNNIDDVAWYGNSGSNTHTVKTKTPNELGIYDMSGNVWEWCSDWEGSYSSNAQTNPTGPSTGSYRVVRGGNWSLGARFCRVSYRNSNAPGNRISNLGLRLACGDDTAGGTPENGNDNDNTSLTGDKTFTVGNVSFMMKTVAGGTFTMGATSEQGSDADDDEKPAHQVTLSSYYIGETEVTQALWQAVMGSNPSYYKGSNLPVEQVSWNDCQEFITKLNAMTGQKFRLPTEAEWEFAARGGNNSKGYKYSGSNNIDDVAWYWKNSGDKYLVVSENDWDFDKVSNNNCKTHPVAQKTPNELGIYDMSGNVWEWCNDWWGSYNSNAQINPTGPSMGAWRVNRGCSWYYYAKRCRVSYRGSYSPGNRGSDLGLRLAL